MLNVVETKYGKVSGVHGNNNTIMVYKGVPYAKPPVGKLRFRPPVEPDAWEGVRACDTFPNIGLQNQPLSGTPFGDFFHKEFYPYQPKQSEDCLYMNIWTPAESADEKLPVMMWIHGGGMEAGYGHEMEFDGEALAKKGVILITINYRLGRIAFFAHPELSKENEHGVSGNNLTLDQIMALKFIKENISNFGGDPDNVTVFGQSGGAGATRALLASPLAKNLFHKAIIQSGISGVDHRDKSTATLEYAEQWGERVLEVLGLTLDELMEIPESELFEKLEYAEKNGAGKSPHVCLDGYVITQYPDTAVVTGELHDFPIMSGAVKGDLNDLTIDPRYRGMPVEGPANACLGNIFPGFIEKYPPESNMNLYARMEEKRPIYDMLSFGERQSVNKRIPSYHYYFDAWMPGKNDYDFIEDGLAYHSAELWFVFGTLQRCWRPFDGRYYDLAEMIQTYWTNFAKTGNPNDSHLPVWKPYIAGERCVMHMNENMVRSEANDEPELDIVLDYLVNEK